MLYELGREITTITQGNKSVTQYFTELQRLLDDIVSMQPPPTCSRTTKSTLEQYTNCRNVIRFLVGLNEGYAAVKYQILLMNPLPDMDKAFSLVLQAKNQRKVNQIYNEPFENNALMSRSDYGKDNNEGAAMISRDNIYKKSSGRFDRNDYRKQDKLNQYCEYCKVRGHKDNCFKIHGFLEWYKKLQENKGKLGSIQTANMLETNDDKAASISTERM